VLPVQNVLPGNFMNTRINKNSLPDVSAEPWTLELVDLYPIASLATVLGYVFWG
jgi:hypothetical protein